MDNFKCKKCDGNFDNYISLIKHVSKKHNVDKVEFYVDFYLNGIWPLCECGCGEKVKWKGSKNQKFRRYKGSHGTILRLKTNNPWGHNQEAIRKSAETRRKQFSSGERKMWSYGLSMNDESIQKMAKNVSKSYTKERKMKSSIRMKELRLNGKIPTLHGSNHSQWKGGVSGLSCMIYSDVRFYKEWKYPILIRDNFKCRECGNTKKLHIHHNEEKMSEIVRNHLIDVTESMLNNFDLKTKLKENIINYHIKNNISGITLCYKCHGKYHPSLNFK